MSRSIAPRNGGRFTAATVAIAILISLVVAAAPASAIDTDTFRLEPHPLRVDGYERRSFDFDVAPGTTVTDAVRITNKTDEPRRFRLSAADAERDPDTGALAVGSRGQQAEGMGSWIDLGADEIEIPPRASEIVEFSFERPEGSDVAGAGAIVVEELEDAAEAGVNVVYRLALLVQVGGRTPDLTVSSPELRIPLTMVPSEGTLSTIIHNETLAPVRATVQFSVTSLTGRTWSLDREDIVLAPGEERDLRAGWENVPRWGGVLTPHVSVVWQRGSVVVPGDRGIYPPLWLLALAIVLVGIRGLREMWSRRKDRRSQRERSSSPAPDPAALRGRLIEAALWLHAAGRDAPSELRETTIAEAQAIAGQARQVQDQELVHAARSLETFARSLGDPDIDARQAADEFDAWFRQHQDDPRVKELVGT